MLRRVFLKAVGLVPFVGGLGLADKVRRGNRVVLKPGEFVLLRPIPHGQYEIRCRLGMKETALVEVGDVLVGHSDGWWTDHNGCFALEYWHGLSFRTRALGTLHIGVRKLYREWMKLDKRRSPVYVRGPHDPNDQADDLERDIRIKRVCGMVHWEGDNVVIDGLV